MTELTNGYIYCITNIKNGIRYIGATSRTVHERYGQHISDAKNNRPNGCTNLKNAMREFGEDSFKVETLLLCNIEQMDSYENKFIEMYNTLSPNGYNSKTGGNLGSKHCDETKRKIGDAHKGRKVSKETRVLTGETSKYRNMSDENKTKLKNALQKLGLEHLPMYVVLSIDKRNNRNVDKISVRVPSKVGKQFSEKDMPLHEKIKLAIEYKDSLDEE